MRSEGIGNVRKKGKASVVSSLYPYESIIKVHMKNIKIFVIYYQNAKHPYQYKSPVCTVTCLQKGRLER